MTYEKVAIETIKPGDEVKVCGKWKKVAGFDECDLGVHEAIRLYGFATPKGTFTSALPLGTLVKRRVPKPEPKRKRIVIETECRPAERSERYLDWDIEEKRCAALTPIYYAGTYDVITSITEETL